MIDEHHEELAALYACGLLEDPELSAFEGRLGRDAELRSLTRELCETSALLALAEPPPAPSPDLKARLLDRLPAPPAPATGRPPTPVLRFPVLIGWAVAASLAVVAGWLGVRYSTTAAENRLLHQQQALADAALRSARNELEAERIVGRRQLEAATDRIAALGQELRHQGDLAKFKIAMLTSMLGNSPKAMAVAVWDPKSQEGVLSVENLPALPADKDYQLWVVDPQYAIPVDGGVFQVNPSTGEARYEFKAGKPINSVAKFAVSLERKGGVPKAEGPMVLLSQ